MSYSLHETERKRRGGRTTVQAAVKGIRRLHGLENSNGGWTAGKKNWSDDEIATKSITGVKATV